MSEKSSQFSTPEDHFQPGEGTSSENQRIDNSDEGVIFIATKSGQRLEEEEEDGVRSVNSLDKVQRIESNEYGLIV